MPSLTEVLAVIPARAGSKAIANKNIFTVAGLPLIAYTIKCAHMATRVNRFIVSTDSEAIASLAREYGAEVPFLRPAELARDESPGIDPIVHAAHWLEENDGYRSDWVLCLQPTSPLRTAEDVDGAIALGYQKGADAVVSVTAARQHPYWMKSLDPDGRISDFQATEKWPNRRQELPSVFVPNGAIYLARRTVLLEQETWYTDKTYAYVMPPERSLDIDTPWDLQLAEWALERRL